MKADSDNEWVNVFVHLSLDSWERELVESESLKESSAADARYPSERTEWVFPLSLI